MGSEEQLVRRILDIIPPVMRAMGAEIRQEATALTAEEREQVLAGLEVLEKVFTTEG